MFTAQGHLSKAMSWDIIPANVPPGKSVPAGLPHPEGVSSVSHKALYGQREI